MKELKMGLRKKKIDPSILELKRIVYYGLKNNKELSIVVDKAITENKVLVYITPVCNEYSCDIIEAKEKLKDRFWIYELKMAMQVVMKSRALDYYKNHLNSELYG